MGDDDDNDDTQKMSPNYNISDSHSDDGVMEMRSRWRQRIPHDTP